MMQKGWLNQRKKDREKDLCEWVWGGTGLKVNAHDCYSIWTPARINSILHVHLLTRILTNALRFCFFSTSYPRLSHCQCNTFAKSACKICSFHREWYGLGYSTQIWMLGLLCTSQLPMHFSKIFNLTYCHYIMKSCHIHYSCPYFKVHQIDRWELLGRRCT